ncbi:MAG: hypothetical protein V7K55_03900 [Nostoc sp.]|uniref:hypothetical protein n=1 Tax=Nostoc sp. TaxID=1180 RepID=UPI002FFA2B08
MDLLNICIHKAAIAALCSRVLSGKANKLHRLMLDSKIANLTAAVVALLRMAQTISTA